MMTLGKDASDTIKIVSKYGFSAILTVTLLFRVVFPITDEHTAFVRTARESMVVIATSMDSQSKAMQEQAEFIRRIDSKIDGKITGSKPVE